MVDINNVKFQFDSETISTLAKMCELSGLEIPEVIDSNFLSKVLARLKELIINLKNQIEEKQGNVTEHEKTIEELNASITKLKEDLKKGTDTSIEEDTTNKTEQKPEKTEEKPTEEKTEATVEVTDIQTKKQTTKEKNSKRKPHIKSNISKILIIANIGAIMHQLKVIFKKYGRDVTLVKNYSEAIKELKESHFDCILFDMATSSDNDIMIVEALRKATEIQNTDTTLAILMIPNKEGAKKAREKGADLVIEKHESWHINILSELKITTK